MKVIYYAAAAAAIVLSGCGGGGASVPTETNTGTNTNTTEPLPGIDYTDPAQFLQTTVAPDHLWQVNAQVAHNNGYTGGDLSLTTAYTTVESDTSNRDLQTIVAVLDSGVNANHEDMDAAGKIAAWKDFTPTASLTPYDPVGHGSFVSGVIAGERQDGDDGYYGIAYGAQLAVGQVFYFDGTSYVTDNALVAQGLNWVADQKAVLDVSGVSQLVSVNLSLGTPNAAFASTDLTNAMKRVLNSGVSMVVAAGNDALSCSSATSGNCSFPAAIPWIDVASSADYLSSNGGYIVVGSVDANNTISTFSNRAGVMKSHYLVAPGENVVSISSTNNTGYMIGSGTSFSTPIVAGAMALMAQKWPYLSGRVHAQVLFDTATDLGAAGVDDVYGNGLLNLTDAFNPVGTLVLPTALGNVITQTATGANTISTTATGLRISPAMASLASFAPLNSTIGIDRYNRDFSVSMTNSIVNNGSAPVDFDNFMAFRFGNVMFGVDPSRNLPMIGFLPENGLRFAVAVDTETMLGMQGEGALGTKHGQTAYFDVKKVFPLEGEIALGLEGTYAYGDASAEAGSLIRRISPVHALGGKATVSYNGFGIGYEVPLRVVEGEMAFNLPTGIDNEGNVLYTKTTADLSPDSFEQVYSLFYRHVLPGMNFLAEVSRTQDLYGIDGITSNNARVFLNYWY